MSMCRGGNNANKTWIAFRGRLSSSKLNMDKVKLILQARYIWPARARKEEN